MALSAAKSGFTLDDLVRQGPDAITQKRKLAEALLAQSQGIQDIKSPWQGMAQLAQALVGNLKEARLDRAESQGKDNWNSQFSAGMGMGEFPVAPGGGAQASSSGGYAHGGSGTRGDDVAWADAAPEQKAFLNTLAGPESGGRYNVIYGGGTFDDFSHHPEKGVRIQTGPNAGRNSSAAGKYQFLGSTWKEQAAELGLPDFSPVSQDKAAWHLADKTFKAKTGQDLLTVLKSGDPNAIAAVGPVLRDVWTSLPGGIEQGTNKDRFVASYQKYLGQGASPQQAQAAATQETGTPAPKGPAVQVASLDPAAGVGGATTPPAANQTALAQALIEQGIDPNGPQAQAFASIGAGGNPPAMPPPGAPVDPAQAAAPAAQVPIPAPPATGTPAAPVGQGQIPPNQVQLAQALTGGQPDIGLTMGVTPHAPGEGPSLQTLMGMMSSPDAAYMSPQQQKLIEALTGQRMEQAAKQSDPAYQMDLETKRLQLDKLRKGDPSEALDLQLKQAQLKKLQTGDPKDALEFEKLRMEVEDAKKGGKADYKVVNDRLIKTQGDKVEDVTPNAPNGLPPAAKFDDVSGVRKEIVQLPSYKNLSQAVPIYKSMVETAGRDNKASDLNLVYGLGKIMDPTSVVREGELHMANDTQGMADYLNGIIKGIQGEGRLSPEARAQIMTEAYGRVKAYQDVFSTDSEMYRGIAKRSNMNEADVIPNLGEGLSPWTPATPPASANPATPAAPPAAVVPGSPRKTKSGVTWSVQ